LARTNAALPHRGAGTNAAALRPYIHIHIRIHVMNPIHNPNASMDMIRSAIGANAFAPDPPP
jgi:hypothetical protein